MKLGHCVVNPTMFHPQDLGDRVRAILIMRYRISKDSLEAWWETRLSFRISETT